MTLVAELYLVAWLFAVSISVGALAVLMIGRVAGAGWLGGATAVPSGVYAREAARLVRALPWLGVAFVPIALGVRYLYAWTDEPTAYLNVPLWCGRAAIYFAAWWLLARAVVRGSRAAAAAGLPIVGFTAAFAGIDWVMSRAAPWTSTVFGLAFFVGGALAAIAVIAFRAPSGTSPASPGPTAEESGALGRLLLSALCTWAYLALFDALIVWIADLPGEVPWYLARTRGAWGVVFGAIVLGGFVAPFFALLSAPLKRRPRALAAIGAWIAVAHAVVLLWQVLP